MAQINLRVCEHQHVPKHRMSALHMLPLILNRSTHISSLTATPLDEVVLRYKSP